MPQAPGWRTGSDSDFIGVKFVGPTVSDLPQDRMQDGQASGSGPSVGRSRWMQILVSGLVHGKAGRGCPQKPPKQESPTRAIASPRCWTGTQRPRRQIRHLDQGRDEAPDPSSIG
jgi:hypothetical protein